MKRIFASLVVVMVVAIVSPAAAGPLVESAVSGLRNDPVYVHPQAGGRGALAPDAAARLRTQITSGDVPIFIAVLPSAVAAEVGSFDDVPKALGVALAKPGAVGVITDKGFRAGASANIGLKTGQGAQLATQAFDNAKANGAEAVLADWIGRVQRTVTASLATNSGQAAIGEPGPPDKKSNAGAIWLGIGLFLGFIAVVGLLWWRSSKRSSFTSAKRSTSSDVEALGSKIVSYSAITDDDLTEAGERYNWASSNLASATTVADLASIDRAVRSANEAIGRYRRRTDPTPEPDPEPVAVIRSAVPRSPRSARRARPGRTTRSRETDQAAPGNTTIINNYGDSGNDGYWYGGGYRGGRYYQPGYYDNSNFWMGLYLGGAMSDHGHHESGHEETKSRQRDPEPVVDTSPSWGSGSGDWGGSSGGSSSGGGDWGGSSDSGGGGSSDSGSGSSSSGGGDW